MFNIGHIIADGAMSFYAFTNNMTEIYHRKTRYKLTAGQGLLELLPLLAR